MKPSREGHTPAFKAKAALNVVKGEITLAAGSVREWPQITTLFARKADDAHAAAVLIANAELK